MNKEKSEISEARPVHDQIEGAMELRAEFRIEGNLNLLDRGKMPYTKAVESLEREINELKEIEDTDQSSHPN